MTLSFTTEGTAQRRLRQFETGHASNGMLLGASPAGVQTRIPKAAPTMQPT
jgi:hypothetical protein